MTDCLNTIRITDDYKEMAEIGRELRDIHKDKYNGEILEIIRDYLTKNFPNDSPDEIENKIYITIYNYWVYGCAYEECVYHDFFHKKHDEKLTYMTFRVRLQYIDHINCSKDKHILFNKYETYKLFEKEYDRDVILCKGMMDYPVFKEFVTKHQEFVIKPSDLSCGKGVRKICAKSLDDDVLKDLLSSILYETGLCKEKYGKGDEKSVVIEELIDQDERMAVFNPESINGVRLTTVRVNGKIHLYHPWFKIGCDGNFLTCAFYGTMLAGIDPETGIVETPGTKENGEKWIKHPNTHIDILGFKIPEWDALVPFAIKCAEKMPQMSYIGWDFALSKNGWCIMEGNYSGDFMWQVYYGKGMKKEFEDLIGWKLEKDFWWR